MLALTSRGLVYLSAVLAIGTVVAVGLLVRRAVRRGAAAGAHRPTIAAVLVLAVLGQVFAVGATAFSVNDSYGFYTSWADLTGSGPGNVAITTAGLLGHAQGQLQVRTVHRHTGGPNDRLMVWLPPGYDPNASRPYPVVMFLPGQPSSPQMVFRHFYFAKIVAPMVQSRQIAPFVAVFPTLMIAPPRDTECTDIPGGPQAETWLNTDVPAYVEQHYRVQPTGPGWSVLGWSTGAFCAAKLLTAHPGRFGSAVAFGGYYTPLQDRTTGDLFHGNPFLYDHNSPIQLYLHDMGLHGSRLLLISGHQDSQSWPQTRAMIQASAGDPAVSTLVFPRGGHNYKDYRSFLAQALLWAARSWPAAA